MWGGPGSCHCLWATTSGPAPKEVGARISRWAHTRTQSVAETGVVEKGIAGPRPSHISHPDAASPSAHDPLQLLVLLQLGLHLAQPLLDVVCLSRLLAKNGVSSALNDPVLMARGL